ncbi:MAG: D-alanyl-D-alanine carboxypeptidase [Robinsoniella sp.]|nr:D-alanyl-D-alanine carboxypeptidase [Robinsoniella sp.]
MVFSCSMTVRAQGEVEITSPSAILMEVSTGTILYEKDADTRRHPASVTKVMTLLLIFEALEEGKISMEEEAVTSAHAKSMGGSQVYLEEGERQTVETLIKCIVIASGNDAAVTMAEHIAGTEEAFVAQMNERAAELGMENTHFVDCCGLTDSMDHYTSARDIAIMTRQLTVNYPKIFEYSGIWMENITHVTRNGSSEFGLTNTNKLLRSFEGCTGLKTGSTSLAKFCLSATATRNGIDLISVIMAGPDSKTRFNDAATLLMYGFGICSLYRDDNPPELGEVEIAKGVKDTVLCQYGDTFSYLSTSNESFQGIEKQIEWKADLKAPIESGQEVGTLSYLLNGKKIGSVPIVASESVREAGYVDYLKKAAQGWLL